MKINNVTPRVLHSGPQFSGAIRINMENLDGRYQQQLAESLAQMVQRANQPKGVLSGIPVLGPLVGALAQLRKPEPLTAEQVGSVFTQAAFSEDGAPRPGNTVSVDTNWPDRLSLFLKTPNNTIDPKTRRVQPNQWDEAIWSAVSKVAIAHLNERHPKSDQRVNGQTVTAEFKPVFEGLPGDTEENSGAVIPNLTFRLPFLRNERGLTDPGVALHIQSPEDSMPLAQRLASHPAKETDYRYSDHDSPRPAAV